MPEKIDTRKLNEKLLRFAGFIQTVHSYHYVNGVKHLKWINQADMLDREPDLVHSLDAQTKWIYPELIKREVFFSLIYFPQLVKFKAYYEANISLFTSTDPDNPAIAFALAVEKYIDSVPEGFQTVTNGFSTSGR